MYFIRLMMNLKKSMKIENVFFSTYSVEKNFHFKAR
jgi:hypothetical protein